MARLDLALVAGGADLRIIDGSNAVKTIVELSRFELEQARELASQKAYLTSSKAESDAWRAWSRRLEAEWQRRADGLPVAPEAAPLPSEEGMMFTEDNYGENVEFRWKTNDGRTLKLSEMTVGHLMNAGAWAVRQADRANEIGAPAVATMYGLWQKRFDDELAKRGLSPPPGWPETKKAKSPKPKPKAPDTSSLSWVCDVDLPPRDPE